MTYTSPELLLVGAAQNLVLNRASDLGENCVLNLEDTDTRSDLIEEW